jgi:hypothetical protein
MRQVLFVSDIRTANPSRMSATEVESRVEWDMQSQRRWAEIMQAHKCMLKFRLPWVEGLTPYLAGQVNTNRVSHAER